MARTATKKEAPEKKAPETKATEAEATQKKVDAHWFNGLYVNDGKHGIKDAVTPLYKNEQGGYTRTAPEGAEKPDVYAVKVPYEGTPTHQATLMAKDVSFKGDSQKVFSAKVLSFDDKIPVFKDIPKHDGDNVEWSKQRMEIKVDTVKKNVEAGQAWEPQKKDPVKEAMAKGEAVAEAETTQAQAEGPQAQ